MAAVTRIGAARVAVLVVCSITAGGPLNAQEEAPKLPQILLAAPLAASPGETTKLILRGAELKDVFAVRPSDSRAVVKLIEQAAATVPGGQNASRIGDTQVEVELQLPDDFDADALSLIAVTDGGESEPYELLIGGPAASAAEQEPNGGFRECRALPLPLVVDGEIERDRDVDLYAFDVAAGQRVECAVVAAERGSGCDATLTLYDARQLPLAFSDDAGSRDPRLEITAPTSGRYYVAVADANDQGGPAHPYRLVVDAPAADDDVARPSRP